MELNNFQRLIGVWKTEGVIITDGHSKLIGTDTYEFILDGNFILHKADVRMGNESSKTFEIISPDKKHDQVNMQFYNSKGEHGMMKASLKDNTYLIQGDKLKFEGTINEDNSKITGMWYLQNENNQWIEFIDLALTKEN